MCAVDLVPDNLLKVFNLVSDAKPKWFELGFQLQIREVELEVIEKENSAVQACFRKMLSTWLKMVDPLPSWEGLLTALEHDSVNCSNLARSIRQDFDMRKKTNCATEHIKTFCQICHVQAMYKLYMPTLCTKSYGS